MQQSSKSLFKGQEKAEIRPSFGMLINQKEGTREQKVQSLDLHF